MQSRMDTYFFENCEKNLHDKKKDIYPDTRGQGLNMKSFKTENQSIKQSTLLVHPIKMGFHIPITKKSNMNNR